MMDQQFVYNYLDSLSIRYEVTRHEAVFNMDELANVQLPYPEAIAKNLFVCDDKKQNFYLITVKGDKRVDLKQFRSKYGTRRLSLARAEELSDIIGITPGAVSPFCLLNDKEHKVHFMLDDSFLMPPAVIGVHPNDNTATVWLNVEDLLHIIEGHGNVVRMIAI